MDRAGLTGAQLKAYHRALSDHHAVRVSVDVIPTDGSLPVMAPGQTIRSAVTDGQVDMALDGEFTRVATVYYSDPDRSLHLGFTDMLRVWYSVRVDEIDDWVDVPVFTGPVRKLDWSDSVATVEAHGKETYHVEQQFQPFTLKKGMKKTDAVVELLARGGEEHFDVPDLDARIPSSVNVAGSEDGKHYEQRLRRARRRERGRRTVGGQDTRWDHAQKIADSLGMLLFYDARGVATMRRHPGNPCYTFADGDGGTVLSAPQETRSLDGVVNAVRVKGGFPKALVQKVNAANHDSVDKNDMKLKESDRVRYSVTAPKSHPLSPWKLGLNGAPLYLPEFVENQHIRSKAEARAVAHRHLDERLRSDYTFDSMPVPHLEEGDLVAIATDAVSDNFRLKQFSLPLSVGEDGSPRPMSVGYRKLVARPAPRNVK